MEHRSPSLATRLKAGFFCVALGCASAGFAAQGVELPPETRARLEQGQALQKEAASLRAAAEAAKLREDAACARKVLVNDCRAGVKERYLEQMQRARTLEAEGGALERQARQEERELKREDQQARQARQAQELPMREQQQAALRQEREAERERRLAEKEAKARAGARAQAERRQRQAEKQARHAAKVEARMERAAQRQNGAHPAASAP
ncbi:MAG: hypothetical protein N3C59_03000 [Azovibrio sp.]|nr:hypothetical protein [Azovibrio sp.]